MSDFNVNILKFRLQLYSRANRPSTLNVLVPIDNREACVKWPSDSEFNFNLYNDRGDSPYPPRTCRELDADSFPSQKSAFVQISITNAKKAFRDVLTVCIRLFFYDPFFHIFI